MTHSHRMTDVAQIKTFVRGGKARFTLVSTATGNRVTFKVSDSDDGKVNFVKVLTGSDNTNSYTFLGTIFSDGTYRRGLRSPIGDDAPSARAFAWFFDHVATGDISKLEFWHEGRCGRCGRVLTVPESIATGFGPECAGRVGAVRPDMRTTRTDDRHEHAAPYDEDKDEDLERTDDYRLDLTADADETREIQAREREEEVERMNRKLGFPQGYRPAGWMPR
jgi:hypothetical protein